MAAAIEAEKRHQAVPRDPSPLKGVKYDGARGDLDLFRYVSSPIDERVELVVQSAFAQGPDSEAQFRPRLRQDDLYTLLTFSRRRSLEALNGASPAPVVPGLRAMSLIDVERIDWRDAAVAAGLLTYAGQRTKAPVAVLVSEISSHCEPAMAEILRRHAAVPENGLGVGGYREIRTSLGVGLAQDYGHKYAPTLDLVSTAEVIVALIEADEYRVENITTGSDVPAVWLPAAEAATKVALKNLRGCLSVSARPKSDPQGMPDQMFTVWLAEAANPNDALAIATAALPTADSEVAILGLASGRLCGVLVARSVVVGVPPLENMESLERFRAPLQETLGSRPTG